MTSELTSRLDSPHGWLKVGAHVTGRQTTLTLLRGFSRRSSPCMVMASEEDLCVARVGDGHDTGVGFKFDVDVFLVVAVIPFFQLANGIARLG